jgi:hypothetical protein
VPGLHPSVVLIAEVDSFDDPRDRVYDAVSIRELRRLGQVHQQSPFLAMKRCQIELA